MNDKPLDVREVEKQKRQKALNLIRSIIAHSPKDAADVIKRMGMVQAMYDSYRTASFPHVTLSELQIKEMRNAFFAGFHCAIHEVAGLDELNEEESVVVVEAMVKEIKEHVAGILYNWLKSN